MGSQIDGRKAAVVETFSQVTYAFEVKLIKGQRTTLVKGRAVQQTEVWSVFRPIFRVFFLGKAALEVSRERVEDAVDALTSKFGEYKSCSNEQLSERKDRVKQVANELYQQVWQRSEVLESQTREKIRRQVADFSLDALGDATEINELRAELATLRAELAEMKQRATA